MAYYTDRRTGIVHTYQIVNHWRLLGEWSDPIRLDDGRIVEGASGRVTAVHPDPAEQRRIESARRASLRWEPDTIPWSATHHAVKTTEKNADGEALYRLEPLS